MATTPKTKFGHMACLGCGAKVVIKESATGTISGTCQECDLQHQARKHQDCYAHMLKKITREGGTGTLPAPAPAPKPAAKAAPVPAPTMAAATVSKRNTIFG